MKIFKRIIVSLLALILIVGIGVGIYGYIYYKQTVKQVPIEARVTEIRNDHQICLKFI